MARVAVRKAVKPATKDIVSAINKTLQYSSYYTPRFIHALGYHCSSSDATAHVSIATIRDVVYLSHPPIPRDYHGIANAPPYPPPLLLIFLPDYPFQRVPEALGGRCTQRRPRDDVVEAVLGDADGVDQTASRRRGSAYLPSTLSRSDFRRCRKHGTRPVLEGAEGSQDLAFRMLLMHCYVQDSSCCFYENKLQFLLCGGAECVRQARLPASSVSTLIENASCNSRCVKPLFI